MAFSRLCLARNPLILLLHQGGGLLFSSSSSTHYHPNSLFHARSSTATTTTRFLPPPLSRGDSHQHVRLFAAAAANYPTSSSGAEEERADQNTHRGITVSEGSASSSSPCSSSPRKRRGRGGGLLWGKPAGDLIPFRIGGLFMASALGSALWKASENINKLLKNLAPSHLFRRRTKEEDTCYKLHFEVPGLSKDDLKITVEDGYLVIRGEHKEEEQDEEEDNYWRGYGCYYDTSLMLPGDAKVEEIKAEVKDGMLYVTIPRSEEEKKDVREVEIH